MRDINGFLVIISKSESLNVDHALEAMRYRAWNGFGVKKFGNVCVGVCLTGNRKYDDIIHGEFYDPINLSAETEKLAKALSETDGSYALAIPDNDSIIFARDSLGTKPLYYAKDPNNFLLATDPHALAVLGFKANAVEPGFLYKGSIKKIERVKFSSIRYETKSYDLEEAVETTATLLSESIKRRVADRNVILGFGGGLDSSVIAKLAANNDMLAVTVCLKGSLDHKLGRDSADMLGVKHETLLIDEKTVKNCIKHLQKVTQFKNAMHASIACIIYILAKCASENNYDAIMLGQLADELFGGYARYVKYLRHSARKVKDAMFNDVKNAYRDNFERDELASSFYTRLLLPYTALDFVKYAVTIPLHMKLDRSGARKIILRKVAENLGLPATLLYREKKAMQFSSGIYKIVSKLNLQEI
jgi:asparagine synthase (glutamine-hydrolysing)